MNTNAMRMMTVIMVVAVALLTVFVTRAPAQEEGAGQTNGQESEEGNEYILGPNDRLQIMVEGHPEWSGQFTVGPDGNIVLRDVGEVKVQGQTIEGFRQDMTSVLSKYIINPRITIDTIEYRSQVIHVLGEVNRPGEYPTAGKRITLRDAVIMAGLPGRFAATGRVFVITPSRVKPKRRVINLYRVLYRGDLHNNVVLNPGDTVFVPQNILGFINDIVSAVFDPLSTVTVSAARL